MENKEDFWDRLRNNRIGKIIFFIVSMMLLTCIYLPIIKTLKINNERKFDVINDNYTWVYQINDSKVVDDSLVITGWAFEKKVNATMNAFDIVLQDVDTKKRYYPQMQYQYNEAVNSFFQCEYDYTASGFIATIELKKLENVVYEIILKPKQAEKAFATNIYYANNTVTYVNPKDFVPLNISGTELDVIVNQGVLRSYQPQFGIYVYQYANELYWIIDKTYGFIDNDTYIQFYLYTTQIEKLPIERLEKNWLWDNWGFKFSSKEILEWKTGSYRIAKCALPEEYSVTHVITGIDDWDWQCKFRPWYNEL